MRTDPAGQHRRHAPFELSYRPDGGSTTVTCRGEVDIATAGRLEGLLADVLSRSRPDVVLDLHDVTFLDASGLTALIRGDDRARGVGGRLRLANVPGHVARIIRITGLDRRFDTG
ncbi:MULTISPECIES: STAS domain-containing protein [unclassified Nonomuraea]